MVRAKTQEQRTCLVKYVAAHRSTQRIGRRLISCSTSYFPNLLLCRNAHKLKTKLRKVEGNSPSAKAPCRRARVLPPTSLSPSPTHHSAEACCLCARWPRFCFGTLKTSPAQRDMMSGAAGTRTKLCTAISPQTSAGILRGPPSASDPLTRCATGKMQVSKKRGGAASPSRARAQARKYLLNGGAVGGRPNGEPICAANVSILPAPCAHAGRRAGASPHRGPGRRSTRAEGAGRRSSVASGNRTGGAEGGRARIPAIGRARRQARR